MTAPTGLPSRPVRRRSGALLVIEFIALCLVVASAPAAWIWLDGSRPSDVVAGASIGPGASRAGAATPSGSRGPAQSGAVPSPGVSASAAASASPSPATTPALPAGNGTWSAAQNFPYTVWGAGSAVLDDGRMLVVGGTPTASSVTAKASAQVYDPGTGQWSPTTDMLHARAYPMVVKLKDGSVLVAGGAFDGVPSGTAERYSPDDGGWTQAGTMNSLRTQGTATLLDDGRVLVAGGGNAAAPTFAATASAEIYDPATNAWTVAAPMSLPRALHTATLLKDGEVLVAGGATAYTGSLGTVTASAEIYDPRANAWHAAASMSAARYIGSATALGNGQVLVVGGWSFTTDFDPSLATAEIYDPAANRWTATGSMSTGRARFGLVSLPDGRLLAAGGVGPTYRMLATVDLWDPATGRWQPTGSLTAAVMWPAIAVLRDGRALIAGGALDTRATRTTNVCALYAPAPR
jgi:Kelch motif/Galactose oxidase, central domain